MLIDGINLTPGSDVINMELEKVSVLPTTDLEDGREVFLTQQDGSHASGQYVYNNGQWVYSITEDAADAVYRKIADSYTKSEVDAAIDTRIQTIIGTAPANLDTLGEIATQLQNDESAISAITTSLAGKQATLVSGTNIKTINGQSVLGSGDIVISSNPTSVASVTTWTGLPWDLAFSTFGVNTNGEVVGRFRTARAFTILGSQANGQAKAGAAATASTTYTLYKNGTSFGTVVFSAAGTVGSISVTQTSFAIGDQFMISAPATADSTLADIDFTFLAILN